MKNFSTKIFEKGLETCKMNIKKNPSYGEVEHPKTFHETITEWLVPLGYVPVWDNHPCIKPREFHFAKEGIRVICIDKYHGDDKDRGWSDAYYYLHADILLNPHSLSLKTCKYDFVEKGKLEELHKLMLKNVKKIKK